jgi:hypothetical protein
MTAPAPTGGRRPGPPADKGGGCPGPCRPKATSGADGEFLIVGLIGVYIFTQYKPDAAHPQGQTAFGGLGIAGGLRLLAPSGTQ